MKKLLALLLALVLTLSLSVTAFATEGGSTDPTINQNTTDLKNNTTVKYEVNPSYTVTIPGTVTLGNTASVSAGNVSVAKGSKVVVKITGTSGTNNAFTVKTAQQAELTYTITDGSTTTYAINSTVLEVAPSDTGKGSGNKTLTFTAPTNVIYAGTYEGTVTFTVSVVSAT